MFIVLLAISNSLETFFQSKYIYIYRERERERERERTCFKIDVDLNVLTNVSK